MTSDEARALLKQLDHLAISHEVNYAHLMSGYAKLRAIVEADNGV